MPAAKTAEARQKALLQRRDTVRARTVGELHREAEFVAMHISAHARARSRRDVKLLASIVNHAGALVRERPLAEPQQQVLGQVLRMLSDVWALDGAKEKQS